MASIQIINGIDSKNKWHVSKQIMASIQKKITAKNNGLFFLVFKLEKFNNKTQKQIIKNSIFKKSTKNGGTNL